MDVEELLALLQNGDESQRVEAKAARDALGKSALETISAFSNEPDLGGGYLVLGLKKNGRYSISGVKDPDKVQQELANVCRNAFSIRITPRINVHSRDGQTVIVAFVPEAFCRDKPVYIESKGIERGAFRRIGSADYRCTEEDLDLLYQLRRQGYYESELLPGVSWEDISPEAIQEYRRVRARIEPKAEELQLSDQELLLSLRSAVKQKGEVLPTIGGLLLFGSKAALRREMPMAARVDYIVVEGTEWVQDPSRRYEYALEYREALTTLMPRLHAQIMSDVPNRFRLEPGQLQRTDIPLIPRDVIREAVANALMHRDYRSHQPTQIIRYSNRLEFRNAGYSLKPVEELGEPGSAPRNPTIADVFHELRHAETKGTGLRSMKKWMREAGLTTPPIFESRRDGNRFELILLPHHLLDHEALQWLSQFREVSLSDDQRRALILAKEIGAVTNQDYRQLNGADTLTASSALRGLREAGLLLQKGKGSGTYYVLADSWESSTDKEGTPQISPADKEGTPQISSADKEETPQRGLQALPVGFPELPEGLKQRILSLRERAAQQNDVKEIIKCLCAIHPLSGMELAKILGRTPTHLRCVYLTGMIRNRELAFTIPDQPAHPKQAYRTVTSR